MFAGGGVASDPEGWVRDWRGSDSDRIGSDRNVARVRSGADRGSARECVRVGAIDGLNVHEQMRARAFYAKYGFRQLRRVAGYYEDGADGLSLAKDLGD